MNLNLLPSLNKNNTQKNLDYSINYKGKTISIKKDLIDSYQKAVSYKYISPSIKNRILSINNKENKNKQNFNLTLSKEFIDKHNSKYLLSDTINNNKLKSSYKELNKTFNRKIKNLSIYNNSYSREPFENIEKRSQLYQESKPSFKSTSSSKKNSKPISIENDKNNKTNENFFVKKSFNLLNFSKKMKKLNNNSENNSLFKPKLTLSNKYIAIPSPKQRNKDQNEEKNKLIQNNESIEIEKETEKETEKNNKILSLTTDDFNPINKEKKNLQKELIKKKKNIMKELLKEKKYRKILKNPDLKVLYNINRKKMIKMIKSQSKTNKLKLSLIDYQNNLIRNNPKLKTEFLKRTLNKGFQYLQIQYKMTEKKTKSLVKYINYIQNKELDVINESNNFNQNLYSKMIELGFSPRKYDFKVEKIEYKDVLTNYK
jgi:hypothetical protein